MNTLEKEWHTKNELPFDAYTKGSHFKAWWVCSACEHEWQSTVSNRVSKGSKCPNCRKLKSRGNKNPAWTGYGEISGRQWLHIERDAARRNIPVEITIEDAWELYIEQDRKCMLTGKPITMWGKKDGQMTGTAILDRKDSTKGFVEDNVQWIEKSLHQVKRNLFDKDFISICEQVASYQAKKKLASLNLPSFEEWTQAHL